MRIRLTDLSVRQLPFTDKGQLKIRDEILPGFGLIVGKKSKSFFVMHGKDRRTQVIGRYPVVSLSDARREAMLVLATNPRKNTAMGLTAALRDYFSECEVKNRPNTIREYRRYLSTVPDKPLSEIKRSDIDTSHSHTVMAWRVFFNWCLKNELVDRNPFNHLPTKVNKRERVLADGEIQAIWRYDYLPFSSILKVCLLTGQRRSQFGSFNPEWYDDNIITFPSEIMKGGRDHQIPIGSLCAQFLPDLPDSFSGWSKAKARADKNTGVTDWTLHDLRRTFATIHAQLGTPIHVVEAYLAHTSGTISGVAAIYIRHNWLAEMREAVARYEDHIAKLVGL